MTPSDLMNQCQQSGVILGMDTQGGLTYRGEREIVSRLLPEIRKYKQELLGLLAANDAPYSLPTRRLDAAPPGGYARVLS